MKNNTFMGIFIGICLTVTGFHVYFYYKLASQVFKDASTVAQIVQLINKSNQQQTPQQIPVTAPSISN